jgi:hypothetical protein
VVLELIALLVLLHQPKAVMVVLAGQITRSLVERVAVVVPATQLGSLVVPEQPDRVTMVVVVDLTPVLTDGLAVAVGLAVAEVVVELVTQAENLVVPDN